MNFLYRNRGRPTEKMINVIHFQIFRICNVEKSSVSKTPQSHVVWYSLLILLLGRLGRIRPTTIAMFAVTDRKTFVPRTQAFENWS